MTNFDSIPTLELETIVQRPRVLIDGEPYDLRHPDEFSLVEQMRMMRGAQRVLQLVEALTSETGKPTDAEEQEYETLLDKTCRAVLVAPEAVHQKLREGHWVAISRAFTELQSIANRRGAGAQEPTTDPQIPQTTSGTDSSPLSSGSTEEIQSVG